MSGRLRQVLLYILILKSNLLPLDLYNGPSQVDYIKTTWKNSLVYKGWNL